MAGGWGSGYRGTSNRGGTAVSGGRFSVLSEEPRQQAQNGFGFGGGGGRSSGGFSNFGQQSAQQGVRGRGRGGAAPQKPHWKDVVRSDTVNERPDWKLTCYAHERGGGNDVAGDTSFEELRWSQLQTATAGARPEQIAAAETAMFTAHESRWQQLVLSSRPPSLGGTQIALPNTGCVTAAVQPGGFAQPALPASGFPGAPFAPAASPPTGFAPALGSSGGFGSQSTAFGGAGFAGGGAGGGGFGGGGFGSAQPNRSIAFGGGGAATAPAQQVSGQQLQQGSFGSAFGGGFASRPVFGSQQSQQKPASSAAAGPFQAQATAAAYDRLGATATGDGGVAANAADPWHAPKFTRGMIPEEPPS